MPPQQDKETAQWFENEVQPHESALRRYLYGMVDACTIDDIVQETYSRLIRTRQSGKVRSTRGLLFAAARNAVRDLFRRRSTAKTTAVAEIETLQVLDDSPGTPEIVSLRQEAEILEAAIRALPERCRVILVLRKFENLSHREIAARLNIAEHTVEAQLTKGLRRCEEFFKKLGAFSPSSRAAGRA